MLLLFLVILAGKKSLQLKFCQAFFEAEMKLVFEVESFKVEGLKIIYLKINFWFCIICHIMYQYMAY